MISKEMRAFMVDLARVLKRHDASISTSYEYDLPHTIDLEIGGESINMVTGLQVDDVDVMNALRHAERDT